MKTKNISKEKKTKINTYFILWTIIAGVSSLIVFAIIYFILNINMDVISRFQHHPGTVILLIILIEFLISIIMTIVIGNPVVRSMNEIDNVILAVSEGDYKVRISETKALKNIKHNFNKMIAELDSVEILKSDFINNFSHELKTPLVSIKGYAEELKRDDISLEDKNKYLDIIIEESKRLTALSTNILNISKIEKQEIITNLKKVNIGEQIRKTLLMFYKQIEDNNITLDLDIDDCYALVNEDLMQQVWINLIENALKFNKENGSIAIKVKEEIGYISSTFQDSGIGIDSEDLKHIYDKFYTTSSKEGISGNGLGLALTKKILDLHDAQIDVLSQKDKGTIFTIKLHKNI